MGCCPESQNRLKQLVPDRKGLKTLEPYEGKLSSTVPRRGEAGNCFFLSDNACKGAVFSSIDVVKKLVDKTSTSKGLKVFSTIKDKVYASGRKVSENFKKNMKIVFDDNLGKWNYKAIPSVKA